MWPVRPVQENLLIGSIRRLSAHVSAPDGDDASHLLVNCFQTPEAAAAKSCYFMLSHLLVLLPS